MQQAKGFTLIELMIVVAIVAIIAAIAIPSYVGQVRKGRRADATKAIGQLQLDLERHRAENPSYATFPIAKANALDTTYYDFTAPGAGADGDTNSIIAVPLGDQENDKCGTMTWAYNAGVITKTPASGCL